MINPQSNKPLDILQKQGQSNWIFVIIVLGLIILYLFNISGWLIHDDEGTDLYEAWQLQIGNQPGVDFIAEQQPLFLLLGKTGMNLADSSGEAVGIVRTFSAVQILAASIFLGLVIRRKWGYQTAAMTIGVMLTSGILYEQARLYRPDPMMFAWEIFGLGFVLLALQTGKRPYWSVAGVAYGVAILMKLFGIFPVIGLAIFFVYLFYKEPKQWKSHLQNGIAFALPFLFISGGISFLLYSELGFYYQEVFNQHLSLGQEKTIFDQVTISLATYLAFILVNAVTFFNLPLAIMNRISKETIISHPEKALIHSQLLVPLIFIFITRPIFTRYFIFLLPTLALLLALQMQGFFNKIDQNHPKLTVITNSLIILLVGFSFFSTFPTIKNRLTRSERDTLALAELIQNHTRSSDVVVSDYAGLNYHANRPSIYEASIIAGGRIGGGIITGELLIEKIEAKEARLILFHIEGGSPSPHHFTDLIDLSIFETYLEEKYQMIEVFDRAGQLIEIYERR